MKFTIHIICFATLSMALSPNLYAMQSAPRVSQLINLGQKTKIPIVPNSSLWTHTTHVTQHITPFLTAMRLSLAETSMISAASVVIALLYRFMALTFAPTTQEILDELQRDAARPIIFQRNAAEPGAPTLENQAHATFEETKSAINKTALITALFSFTALYATRLIIPHIPAILTSLKAMAILGCEWASMYPYETMGITSVFLMSGGIIAGIISSYLEHREYHHANNRDLIRNILSTLAIGCVRGTFLFLSMAFPYFACTNPDTVINFIATSILVLSLAFVPLIILVAISEMILESRHSW